MITIELSPITNIDSVKEFFKSLASNGINFHPDDSFEDYVYYETKQSKGTFSMDHAKDLDLHMEECFMVCDREGIDICGLALETKKESITKDVFDEIEILVSELSKSSTKGKYERDLQRKAQAICLQYGITQSLDEWAADNREKYSK